MKDRAGLNRWNPGKQFEALTGLWEKASPLERLYLAKLFSTMVNHVEGGEASEATTEGLAAALDAILADRAVGDNIITNTDERGSAPDYLARRLLTDSPDTFDALKRGEYPSVHAAAVEAGIVPKGGRSNPWVRGRSPRESPARPQAAPVR